MDFIDSSVHRFNDSSMLAAGSIHRFIDAGGWLLLAGWLAGEDDEEQGFQEILTRSSLIELGGFLVPKVVIWHARCLHSRVLGDPGSILGTGEA